MTTAPQIQQRSVDRHQQAVVIGLGVTGYSVVRYLRAEGLAVRVIDRNPEPALASKLSTHYPEVETLFGDHKVELNETLVVPSPGVSLRSSLLVDAAQEGLEIVGDIELFAQENSQRLIAITGSNGKSTVTSLVGQMCAAAGLKPLVAGNIGRPALDAIVDQSDYDIAVLELSSFQLETVKQLNADSATILNISADHMDRYDSMGDYILAKARILRGAACAVLPSRASGLEQITKINKALKFGLEEPQNDTEFGLRRTGNRRWLSRGKSRLMPMSDVPLVGSHNIANVLSAFALVDFLKLPKEPSIEAVKHFKGLAHRMQTVAELNGVRWVNDSKATNVGAAMSALQSIDSKLVWLAGGDGKDADFTELHSAIQSNIKCLIAFGQDADKIAGVMPHELEVVKVETLEQAVQAAAQVSQSGDTVLLSPACASFDQFDNFEHRGDVFTALVEQLAFRESAHV